MNQINILSLGWRSHWLACELALRGVRVSLYEITDHAGWSHPEDIDGPFPVNFDSKIPDSFIHLTLPEGSAMKVDEGFSLSTPKGLCSFALPNNKAVLSNWKENFSALVPHADSFWVDDFLKSFSRSNFQQSDKWASDNNFFNVNEEQFVRTSDRTTFKASIGALEERGVEVISIQAHNLELFLNEIKKNPAGWIVSLTIPELKILTHNEVPKLDELLGWHRKRFFFNSDKLDSLPPWSVWVDSPFKAWKGLNQVIMIKGVQGDFVDLWSLVPVYNDLKVKEVEERLHVFLKEMFSYVNFEPQLSTNLEGALNTMFPVTTSDASLHDKNFVWNSPKEWGGYRLSMQYEFQSQLVESILNKKK